MYKLCSKYLDDESNAVKVDVYGNYDCGSAHLISHDEVCH